LSGVVCSGGAFFFQALSVVLDAEESQEKYVLWSCFMFVILIISHMNTFDDFYYWFVVVRSVLSVLWIFICLIRLIFWGLD